METAETVTPPRAHLYKALAAAQKRAEAVEKDATNTFHKYKYASAEAIIAEARQALSEEGLAVFPLSIDRDPQQVDHKWEGEGDAAFIDVPRRIRCVYLLVHESGESMEFASSTPVIPEKGRPEDKAEFGARTENLGYALRDLLLLPRVQDGAEAPSGRDDRGYQGPRHQEQAKPPAQGSASQGPPDAQRTERALRLTKLLTGKAPDGLGMPKPAAFDWLKKRFGRGSVEALSDAQVKDAEILALARMTGDKEYKSKVAELAAAGRCFGDDQQPKGEAA